MRRNPSRSILCAAALAYLAGFGGAACMVTGLALPVDLDMLAMGCILGALIPPLCLCLRRGELLLSGITAGATVLMAFSEAFREQLLAMCYSILTYYHKGYGIPIPIQIEGCVTDSQHLPLLYLAGLVMTAVTWTVCRGKRALPTVVLAAVPLMSCLVVTNTPPDVMPLFLLMLGLVLLIMTQSVRRLDRSRGNRLTAILAVPVTAALGVLFFMVPPDTYAPPEQLSSGADLLEWFSQQVPVLEQTSEGDYVLSFGNNAKTQVNLSQMGNRTETESPMLEITTDYTGTLYLRSRDYDVYTGLSWEATGDRTEEGYGPNMMWQTGTKHASIRTLGRHAQYYLPCYPTERQTFYGGRIPNDSNATEYSYPFCPLRADWKSLWGVYNSLSGFQGIPQPDQRYLELPPETRERAEKILAQMAISAINSDLKKAEAIERYVEQSAVYDLSPGRMSGEETDFALWFLESSDSGYCVHFATAATVLLRATGIPARYVEGFTCETQSDETTIVRQKDAHAWVEIYLSNLGWVILDPTPGTEDIPDENTSPTSAPTKPTETQPTVPSTSPATTTPSVSSSTGGSTGGNTGTETPDASLPQWFVSLLNCLLWSAVAALAFFGQYALRRWLTLKQARQGSVNKQAVTRYRIAVRLGRALGEPVPDTLKSLAEKAKFSQHTLSAKELEQFDRFIRSCVAALRQRPWYRRLMDRFVFAHY